MRKLRLNGAVTAQGLSFGKQGAQELLPSQGRSLFLPLSWMPPLKDLGSNNTCPWGAGHRGDPPIWSPKAFSSGHRTGSGLRGGGWEPRAARLALGASEVGELSRGARSSPF